MPSSVSPQHTVVGPHCCCTLQMPLRPGSPGVADDWEVDINQLQIDAKVASGSFSNLYKGSYCGQEVAVKILKDVADDTAQYQEFLQVLPHHALQRLLSTLMQLGTRVTHFAA
jgi:hypothetical protein